MHTGHVKTWNEQKRFGYVVTDEGREYYVSGDVASGDVGAGDLVEVEVGESDGKRAITALTVTKSAPAGSPVGKTMAAPPSWDQLEEVDRERRAANRRRR
ncbi:MAG TPA: hypothetical protein VGA36_06225 [Nitriliruptorales bacterium]